MSGFFSEKYSSLVPYVPGEQPQDREYIKLNTNESPFPPSAGVARAVCAECARLRLYSDPECTRLRDKLAETYGVSPRQVMVSNGSDEALNLAFAAFADAGRPLAFADVTYGFYPVFAAVNALPYEEIPLKEDFSIDANDYLGIDKTIVIANPNAPTGLCLAVAEIEKIVRSNPRNVVIVDEAYVDFGAESAVPLIRRYDNLLVIGTFSKSRSMAGARLGFAIGCEGLIADLNTLRYSTNPYNVNRMTLAAGCAALCDNDYYTENCRTIERTREWTAQRLSKLGFEVLPSKTNFLFARSKAIDGKQLYLALKKRGILVRHFDRERIGAFVRVTIGTKAQMQRFLEETREIIKETEK